MSVPTGIQRMMLSRVENKNEFIALVNEIPDAFIKKSDSIAPDVLQMILDGSHVGVIAQYVFSKSNAAKHDRATADIEIKGDNVFSAAPLGDRLNFVGLLLDVPTAGMTLDGALNSVRFHYQVPDGDDAPATAAAATSKTSGAGSSSSAIDLLDDDEDEDPVPPPKTSANAKKRKADRAMINTAVPSDASSVRSDASAPTTTHPSAVGSPVVGGKAKASNLQILGSPELKATLDALVGKRLKTTCNCAAMYHNKFMDTLKKYTRKELQPLAERMEVNKYQTKTKSELVKDIATETCQFAVNELNNGRV
jgi:hypothetical protein